MHTEALEIFVRQILNRSRDHQRAMRLLVEANIPSQMMAVLRQELDSMVRVIYLLSQDKPRRRTLILAAVDGDQWRQSNGRGRVTDQEMVNLAQHLQGWTLSVYKFGCAFIHLSNLHDYNDRDPLELLDVNERTAILEHCRSSHGGPSVERSSFQDLIPYLPKALDKVSDNLRLYLKKLQEDGVIRTDEI